MSQVPSVIIVVPLRLHQFRLGDEREHPREEDDRNREIDREETGKSTMLPGRETFQKMMNIIIRIEVKIKR